MIDTDSIIVVVVVNLRCEAVPVVTAAATLSIPSVIQKAENSADYANRNQNTGGYRTSCETSKINLEIRRFSHLNNFTFRLLWLAMAQTGTGGFDSRVGGVGGSSGGHRDGVRDGTALAVHHVIDGDVGLRARTDLSFDDELEWSGVGVADDGPVPLLAQITLELQGFDRRLDSVVGVSHG